MLLPEIAERFQAAGVTALIYDPRTLGTSDGLPRNNIDPMKQTEDYSDALDFLMSQPTVDPARIGFWGMSFSGTVSSCAAALDKRARFLITVCPMSVFYEEASMRKALGHSLRDRHSQLKGNPAYSLPPFTKDGMNLAGMASRGGKEIYEYLGHAKERAAPTYDHKTTMQTYYKVAMWQPHALLKLVAPTPVLMLVPELDTCALPHEQMAMFEQFTGPKRMHVASGKGHLDVLTGQDADMLQGLQHEFIWDVLGGKMGS